MNQKFQSKFRKLHQLYSGYLGEEYQTRFGEQLICRRRHPLIRFSEILRAPIREASLSHSGRNQLDSPAIRPRTNLLEPNQLRAVLQNINESSLLPKVNPLQGKRTFILRICLAYPLTIFITN